MRIWWAVRGAGLGWVWSVYVIPATGLGLPRVALRAAAAPFLPAAAGLPEDSRETLIPSRLPLDEDLPAPGDADCRADCTRGREGKRRRERVREL